MEQESVSSILSNFFQPAAIATLANESALYDLKLLCTTLQVWNAEPPTIYLYCSSAVVKQLNTTIKYTGKIEYKVCLDAYSNLTRQMMESKPSKRGLSNLFHDFTEEKCGLMDWALKSLPSEKRKQGILFCDADIFWLSELPTIPEGKTLALSPHMIRPHDESKYGHYNAGFLWTNQETMSEKWREACKTSRFFEQAALEDLADSTPDTELYIFGEEYNYGWWRMYQSPQSFQEQQKAWTIHRDLSQRHSGLCVNGKPVYCIHTHWKPTDSITLSFNVWILERLQILKKQSKVKTIVGVITF